MPSQAKPASPKRILVVEDELMIRMLLDGMLTDLGHKVTGEAGKLDEASAQRLRESAAHYAANGRRFAKGLVAIG